MIEGLTVPVMNADLVGVPVGTGYPVRLMAAVNVSPESFYSGSVMGDDAALRQAVRRAVEEGADFIDIGAMSTAPYLETRVSEEEETARMLRALDIVRDAVSVPISADTKRAAVAAAALGAGARMINDVSGLREDPAMADVAAQAEGVVLTASELEASCEPPLDCVRRLLRGSLQRASRAGIALERIVVDPGIGFFRCGSEAPERFTCMVLRRLGALAEFGRPVLVGVSRKSFIGRITGREAPADRLSGSLAATAIAVYEGASIVRTHDVGATRDAVKVAAAIRSVEGG